MGSREETAVETPLVEELPIPAAQAQLVPVAEDLPYQETEMPAVRNRAEMAPQVRTASGLQIMVSFRMDRPTVTSKLNRECQSASVQIGSQKNPNNRTVVPQVARQAMVTAIRVPIRDQGLVRGLVPETAQRVGRSRRKTACCPH